MNQNAPIEKIERESELAPVRFVCVADPNSLRWINFADELARFSDDTGTIVRTDLIGWHDLIEADGDVTKLATFDAASYEQLPAIVRIESPARDFRIIRALLSAGARETGDLEDEHWAHVEYEKAKIVQPKLVFLGLKRILTRLGKAVGQIKGLRLLANPCDIVSMFDKNETSQRLRHVEISTPAVYSLAQWPKDYQSFPGGVNKPVLKFVRDIFAAGFHEVYIKLAYGSSSSGMIYLLIGSQSVRKSATTMAQIGDQFFNTRLVHGLNDNELGSRLDFLFQQDLTIQHGIRKSKIDGDNFDVRVVVIDGKIEFTIFRVSQHEFTNLHLGGYRGDWERCRAAIPDRAWFDAMDDCVRAAELYDSHLVGVDLAFDRSYANHFIIELNPFGDFFPGWVNPQGKSIHRVEIESAVEILRRSESMDVN